MSYILAIDVGTSFTAAAIARTDRNAPPVPESLPLGLRGTSVPSVLYYPEEGPILVGEAAERRGLDSPGRVVREFKRRIGDAVPIAVGTLALPAEEVFATMARWVADRAEEREGAPPSDIILTHPAAWGSHRTGVIREALAARGMGHTTLISEPVAAALHYAAQVRVADGSTIAVYDLGGGTFDTAILRKNDAGTFEILGRPEGIDGLGGADFDSEVLRYVAAHTGDALAALDPVAPGTLAAVARLRRECVEAKEALSADTEANIAVVLPGVQQQVRLVRAEFEAMIEEPVRATVDALERSLDELGLDAEDLTAVLLIGGSSRIPLVAQLISEQLDRPIAVDADPKSSICLGAAVAALRAAEPALASARPAVAGSAAELTGAELADVGPAVVEAAIVEAAGGGPYGVGRRASWSRKAGAGPGSLTGTAAAGVGARAHGGAHRPRPTVRLTAVAAAAALFTVLTATAAQSPEGGLDLGSLTSLLAPPGAEADDPGAATAPTGAAAPVGAAAGAPAGSGPVGSALAPMRGIEASIDKKKTPAGLAGSTGAAATGASADAATALPATGLPATSNGTSDAAAGATTAGTGGSAPVPTQASGGAGSGTPTGSPGDPATNPPAPVPDPATDPRAPVPDPATDPPAPVPDPATDPPAPVPDPATDPPATGPPAPVPDPTTDVPAPVPEPTTNPAPQPSVTQAADPVPTEPAV